MEKNKVIRVTSERNGAGMTMGSLEFKVFEACCKLLKCSVRQVLDELGSEYAYTTVMTTCDRLAKKGILNREKCGKCYLYSPSSSREDMDIQATCKVLGSLINSLTEPVVANFLTMLEETSADKLALLERMINERKNGK